MPDTKDKRILIEQIIISITGPLLVAGIIVIASQINKVQILERDLNNLKSKIDEMPTNQILELVNEMERLNDTIKKLPSSATTLQEKIIEMDELENKNYMNIGSITKTLYDKNYFDQHDLNYIMDQYNK